MRDRVRIDASTKYFLDDIRLTPHVGCSIDTHPVTGAFQVKLYDEKILLTTKNLELAQQLHDLLLKYVLNDATTPRLGRNTDYTELLLLLRRSIQRRRKAKNLVHLQKVLVGLGYDLVSKAEADLTHWRLHYLCKTEALTILEANDV